MIKLKLSNPLHCPTKSFCNYLLFIIFLSFRIRMSWKIGTTEIFFSSQNQSWDFIMLYLQNTEVLPEK